MPSRPRIFTSLLLTLLLLPLAALAQQANAPEPAASALNESQRFRQFLADDWKRIMEENPGFATFIGYPGFNDRWTDPSWEAIQARRRSTEKALATLELFDRAKLDPADQLNYHLYRKNLKQNLEGDLYPRGPNGEPGFGSELMPINQLGGPQQDPAQIIDAMPTFTVKQYEDIVERLRTLPAYLEQSLDLMKRGPARGLTPPRITLRNVPEQVKAQMVDDPTQHPLLRPFQNYPDSIPPAERERLTAEANAALTRILPAYQKLYDYLVNTYIPAAREQTAMSELPDGQAWYAYRVRRFTTTGLTPEQIHQIGLAEVKRIRAEMEDIIKQTGFEGDLAAFREFLHNDPQFFYSDKEELLRDYRSIAKRADAATIKLFRTLPRLPYAIQPVPDYAEKSAPGGYYRPGSVEFGRPGTFFANTYDLKSRPKWEMEDLILHEAVPGHHFQIAIAQELEGMPEFRKWNFVTAYTEGWGLYAETLGEEMGFLQDPYSKFGQLTGEVWRAARLVVDTGLHAKGWTRQQAIDFFRENTAVPDHDITVEVDRYIVIPGQALAYKIGQLKITELSQYAQLELGDAFDLRAFHDQVLGNGALPLDILEAHIKQWVAQRKAALQEAAATPTPAH